MFEVYDDIGLLKTFETYQEAVDYCGGMQFKIKEVKLDWEPLF